MREADLSAKQARAQAAPWLPPSHEDGWGPDRARQAPGQGSQAPVGLRACFGIRHAARLTRNSETGSKRAMIQRIARLKRRSEFLRASSAGRKCVTRGLILQAVPRAQSQPEPINSKVITIGYTASRRVGGAVMRNRAKRRLRAAVARVMPARAAEGYDYVLIARPETLKRPFDGLVSDLKVALARLGLERDTVRGAATPDAGARRSRSAAGQPEAMKE